MTLSWPIGLKKKKIKILCSLDLYEFANTKCLIFFDFTPFGRDIALFWFLALTVKKGLFFYLIWASSVDPESEGSYLG